VRPSRLRPAPGYAPDVRLIKAPASLLRASLVTTLIGHWIANAMFDRDQYAGADPRVLAHLDDPLLVQAGLVVLAIAVLTAWDRRRERRGIAARSVDLPYPQLAALLVGTQLVLFIGLEATERLAIVTIFPGESDVGVFGAGFVAELLVAVGSALVLAALGEVTTRIVVLLRPEHPEHAPRVTSIPSLRGFDPTPRMLVGAGGVRAPPA
jgi:hypothetical protein